MTTPATFDDLVRSRAHGLDAIDDIFRTAAERPEGEQDLTEAERADVAYLSAACDDLQAKIEGAYRSQSAQLATLEHEARRSWTPPQVNVNRITTAPPTASRSLDELLYASPESVPAGSLDKAGAFRQHSNATAAVEPIVVRSASGDLLPAPRLGEILPEHQSAVRAFQQTVNDACLFGMMIDPKARTSAEGYQVARSHPAFADRLNHVLRAMDTDTSAEGTEWVPTGIGATLHEKVRAMGKVAPLFARVNLPTNPWKWPIEAGDATAYRVAEPTSDTESKPTASTPGSAAATFDAEIFGARTLFSRSLEADSALAILPFVTRKLALAFSIAEERAVLDGDSDGTHQDSDIGASTTDAVTAWDGLRKRAIAQTVATATTVSVANLLVVRKAMGKWGVNPADLAYIIHPGGYHSLLADSNMLTVDKMGPNATILNGMVGSVGGVPVIVSEYMRETLNASGVYDGITTTKTYILCVNRNEWAFGQRMALDVQVDDSVYRETYQRVAVAFMREDFQSIASASTDETTAIAYNVTP